MLEIDPVTLEIVWQMTPKEAGYLMPLDANRFYSPFISGMQRLPNGNTTITEGSHGRIFEVTPNTSWCGNTCAPTGDGPAHEHGVPFLPSALRMGAAA